MTTGELPPFVRRFVRSGDRCFKLGESNDSPVLVRSDERRRGDLLHARLLLVNRPKEGAASAPWFVRAHLNDGSALRSIVVEGEALVRYFYRSRLGRSETLYSTLGVNPDCPPSSLRFAWRMRTAETAVAEDEALRRGCEKAFNILANPDLRACYDSFLADDMAMLPFPYGGEGDILVAGDLSKDGSTFFARAILSYKPTTSRKRLKIRLRSFEFLPDRLGFLESRRKLEVWLDSGLLNGFRWDTSWNNWKHWLRSAIELDATFVNSARYRYGKGEWQVRSWWTALPSRIALTVTERLETDVERARGVHELLGRYSEFVHRVREQAKRQPLDASDVQSWLDQLGAAPDLRPEYLCWKPDYEEYYFAQLRKRAVAWLLFREEFLFVLQGAIISEIPMPGHATYVFALPSDRENFLRLYERTSRNEIRQNAGNVASELGFVGRVVRGRKRKRWLTEVLKLAGEQVNLLDAVDD
ncbi:MAG TPA: hypothetical protein PLF84_00070 [Bryobacteraceae bacterium]|nr:hypothetical protein [Bryobacteraceae bacterium]